MKNTILTLAALSLLASSTFALRLAPSPRPVGGGNEAPVIEGEVTHTHFSMAPIVLTATLESSRSLMQTRSLPPITVFELTFKNAESLRGKIPEKLTFRFPSKDAASLPKAGDSVILLLGGEPKSPNLTAVLKADEKKLAEVKTLLALPIGWDKTADGLVSPWAGLHDAKWPAALAPQKDIAVCIRTQRPAYLLPAAVDFTVAQVPPAVRQQYKNDFGDGSFKLTLTNTSKEKITLACLLEDKGSILWNKSLLVFNEGNLLLPPDAAPIPASAKPVTLEPNQSISHTFNTLTLDGISWPRGGNRVHFTFALANRPASHFFYFFSELHDPMIEKAKAK